MVCPPIELQGDANLTLVVDGTFTVTGGAAGKGADTKANVPGKGGHGGCAGISVPVGTVLTVTGNGILHTYGGDAGSGGNAGSSTNVGGSGGGGAGAGIGGNGAVGGDGGNSSRSGGNGGNGAGMGTVNILNTVTVNAYGGGGGSGSWCNGYGGSGGDDGGAGGYPAAGVGGGGAGGGAADWDNPGGGFTGGRGETNGAPSYVNKDGEGSGNAIYGIAGGYFRADYTSQRPANMYSTLQGIGGIATIFVSGVRGGDGGTGGSGGTVKISEKATLHAYNGSYETTISQNYGKTPTPIYAQSGYDLGLLRKAGVTKVDAGLTKNGVRSKEELEKELGATGKSSTIKATGLAGVGSGAGATEASNGTFAVLNVPGKTVLISCRI